MMKANAARLSPRSCAHLPFRGLFPRSLRSLRRSRRAGVFRFRAIVVGTVAYQTYSAMLSVRLPAGALQTADIDIAQFKNVSVAIGDSTPPATDNSSAEAA
jgi:hypothetical protein